MTRSDISLVSPTEALPIVPDDGDEATAGDYEPPLC